MSVESYPRAVNVDQIRCKFKLLLLKKCIVTGCLRKLIPEEAQNGPSWDELV